MAILHVQEHLNDLKSVEDKGVTGKLDVGDAGLKEAFTGSATPVVSIHECWARNFHDCGGRDIVMGHRGNCFGCQRHGSTRGR